MAGALAHRGPDGDGFFSENGVVLGHRRLKILDLSEAARQPIWDEHGRVAVSYNGEIYNYRELRAQLEARGHQFRSSGDTAIIPAAYLEWGLDFASHLRGMFAIALYDRREHRVVLARDRIGIKPLYIARIPDGVVFASEMRAIVAGGYVDASANDDALREFLRFGYRTSYATCYSGIEEVPPGTLFIIEASGATEIRRFWQYPEPRSHTYAEIAPQVRAILDRAIARHLQSDVAVGAHLSGGLDSSAIVSLMAVHSKDPVQAFSVYFPDESWFDERKYSRLVCAAWGANQHLISPTWRQVRDDLSDIVESLDEPVGGPGAISQYFLNAAIHASGVTVVLGGQGGDELFAGYERYRLPHAVAAVRDGAIREAFGDVCRAGIRRIALDLAKRVLQIDPAAMLVEDTPSHGGAYAWDFSGQLAHEFRWYLPMLLHVEDRTSMAWSIESRVPFLDDELLDYILAVPATMKIKDGNLKWILRESTKGVVPDAILDRRDKRGLPTPLGIWMRGPLRSFVEERLSDPVLRNRGLVNYRALSGFLDAHISGMRNFDTLLWRPLIVAIWLAQLADQRSGEPMAAAG